MWWCRVSSDRPSNVSATIILSRRQKKSSYSSFWHATARHGGAGTSSVSYSDDSAVARHCPHATTEEVSRYVTRTAVAMQRQQHAHAQWRHTKLKRWCERCSLWFRSEAIWPDRQCSVQRVSAAQLRVQLWSVNQWATEAEESPLLRLATRKRLVKTLQRNSHCGELLPRKD
jgi:hypothetical protein